MWEQGKLAADKNQFNVTIQYELIEKKIELKLDFLAQEILNETQEEQVVIPKNETKVVIEVNETIEEEVIVEDDPKGKNDYQDMFFAQQLLLKEMEKR